MDGEAGLRMREKGSSLESKVRRKCLIRTLTTQIILHAEFASVCAATLARREEEEKGGSERRGAGKKAFSAAVSRYAVAIEALAGEQFGQAKMRRKVNQTVTGREIGVGVGDNSNLTKGF